MQTLSTKSALYWCCTALKISSAFGKIEKHFGNSLNREGNQAHWRGQVKRTTLSKLLKIQYYHLPKNYLSQNVSPSIENNYAHWRGSEQTLTSFSLSQNLTLSVQKETSTLERAGQKNHSEQTLANPILSFAKKFSFSKCVYLYRKELRTLETAGQKNHS